MPDIDPTEPIERTFERALDGAAWLSDLALELRNRLQQEHLAGRVDDALALTAAIHVARAISLVNWISIEEAANLRREKQP